MTRRTNWAGNLTYNTGNLRTPGTVDEVRAVVKAARRLRVVGSRHSFNAIADSREAQVSLERLTEMRLDERARTVTVGGGVTYEQLAPWLDARGWALGNLASLPGISIAGACATATHGSGVNHGILATAVRALELVTGDGEVVTLRDERSGAREGEGFLGAVVGLGAAGVVAGMTLDVEPAYRVAQRVYQNLGFDELGRSFEAIFARGTSVSVFTEWRNRRATQVWVKKRLKEQAADAGPADAPAWPQEFYGAAPAKENLHPIAGHPPASCTMQMGVPGPWYERLPHFAMGKTPSSGHELQTEYLVPFEDGFAALQAVEKLHARIAPLLFVTELRTIAADRLWMSPAYDRMSLAIHFTWKPEWNAVRALLPAIEAALQPFAPRPHWGKLFTLPAKELQARYRRLPEFKALLAQLDPKAKFRNEFVDANLYA